MTTINVPDSITVPLGRGGKYGQLPIDVSRFNAEVQMYAYVYGLRQIINDAMADKTDDDGNALPDDQIVAKARKRLDNMYAGELRSRRESAGEPADPTEAEFQRLVWLAMREAIKKSGKSHAVGDKTKDRVLAFINWQRSMKQLEPVDKSTYCNMLRETPQGKRLWQAAVRNVKDRNELDLEV